MQIHTNCGYTHDFFRTCHHLQVAIWAPTVARAYFTTISVEELVITDCISFSPPLVTHAFGTDLTSCINQQPVK